MKKFLKVILKVFLSILGLLILVVIIAAIYLNANFINIDKKDKYAGAEIKAISIPEKKAEKITDAIMATRVMESIIYFCVLFLLRLVF